MITLQIDTTPDALLEAANYLKEKSQTVKWGQKRPTFTLINKSGVSVEFIVSNDYCNNIQKGRYNVSKYPTN